MSKDIEALIERLEKATGPNRKLDNDIYRWVHPEFADFIEGRGGLVHPNDGEDQRVLSNIRASFYTSSVDAALALCERMLPGWRWGVASHSIKDGVYSEGPYIGKPKHVDGFRAHVTKPSPLRPMPHIADARTAPLAILLALLCSLNQEESRSEESKNG